MTKIKKDFGNYGCRSYSLHMLLMSGCGGDTESSSSGKATSAVSNEERHPQAQTQPTTNQATQQLLMLKTTVKLKLSFMRSLLRLQSRTLLTLQKTAFMTVLLSQNHYRLYDSGR